MKKIIICASLVVIGGFFFMKSERPTPERGPTKLKQIWLNQVSVKKEVQPIVANEEVKKEEGKGVMTMTEMEREYQSLSLKEIDRKLQQIEKSEELQNLIISANDGGLDPVESNKFITLVRSKAVLIKLAIEKSMNEEEIL